MSLDASDLKAIGALMTKQMADLMKGFGGQSTGTGYRPSKRDEIDTRDVKKNLKNLDSTTRDLSDVFETLLTTAKDSEGELDDLGQATGKYKDAIDKAKEAIKESSKSFMQLEHELQELSTKGIGNQTSYLRGLSQVTKGLTTETAKNIRNQSLFGASLISSHSQIEEGTNQYTAMMKDMYAASRPLNKGILAAAGMLDEKTGDIRDGLDAQDFAKIRLTMGQADAVMAETFGQLNKLGFGDFEKAFKDGDSAIEKLVNDMKFMDDAAIPVKKALLAAATDLQAKGIDVGKVKLIHNEGPMKGQPNIDATDHLIQDKEAFKELVKSMAQLQAANAVAAKGLDVVGGKSGTAAGALEYRLKGLGGVAGYASSKLAQLATVGGTVEAFRNFGHAAMDVYKQLSEFNISNIPGSFIDVQKASISMGMSFEETVKFMQENKRVLAASGKTVGEFAGQFKGTFEKFGYTMAQGAAIVGPTLEAAIASGVNVRNGDELNKYMDKSMESFKSISGIVNMTAAEYAKQNAQMLESDDVQTQLLGLSKEQGVAYADNLVALKNNYIQQGLSADMAAELVKAQQAQKHQAVKDQLRNAAMQQLRGQMAGMSQQDTARMSYLSLRGKEGRTDDENKEYMQLQKQKEAGLAKRKQESIQGGLGSQLGYEVLDEKTAETGLQGEEAKAARSMDIADRNGTSMTDAEAQKKAEESKPNAALASLGNIVNSVTSLFDNKLTAGAGAASMALFSLAANAMLAQGKLGGKGGMVDMIKDLFSKGGAAEKAAAEGAEIASKAGSALPVAAEEAGVAAKEGGVLAKSAGAIGKVGKTAGKVLGKAAVPLAVLAAGYEAYSGWSDASEQEKTGKISHKEANIKKGESAGSAGGGLAGGLAGAAMGAAIGSAVPVVGTIIGGLIGGALGAWGGGALGEKAGGKIAEATTADTSSATPNTAASTPIQTPPPAVSAPGTDTSEYDVNRAEAAATPATDAIMLVQDTTANDYLGTIADNMVQAVKLLQAISDNGDSSSDEALSKIRNIASAGKTIPSASSYITGRASA